MYIVKIGTYTVETDNPRLAKKVSKFKRQSAAEKYVDRWWSGRKKVKV